MAKPNTNKYTEDELLKIASAKNFAPKYILLFIDKYNLMYAELMEDYDDSEDEDLVGEEPNRESALRLASDYLNAFLKEIEKGHSVKWAEVIADSVDNDEVAFRNAYCAVKAESPEQANKELSIHCGVLGVDALYEKHLIYLMENVAWDINPNHAAAIYSEAFKKQVAMGKSEVFAHEYADLMSEQKYSEIGCYSQAQAYDNAIKQGKSKAYANLYAEKFSDFVANNFNTMNELEDDDDFEFGHDQIIGYMKGWEYAELHNLKNTARFINIFQNIYISTYYADSGWVAVNEITDAEILEKTLQKFK